MFRLALALGKTVGEIERTMSAFELREWMSYAAMEPWGDTRADMRAAVIAREVRMSFTTGSRRYSLLDFMPIVKAEFEREQKDSADAIAARFNAMMFQQARGRVIINMPKKRA